jgi:hypothetical protein
MDANQWRFLEIYRHCGVVQEALRLAHLNHSAHDYWMRHDPTYPARFEEADKECTRILEDRAFKNARDGMAKLVLHNGKPVLVEGKKLYEVTYDNRLIMKLLASRDREKYGEYKVVEVNWKDWDGDVSKLSPNAVKALLAVLRQEAARQEAARQEAEEAAREAVRQPVKALPGAVKEKIVEQITAESEAGA